MNSKTPRLEDLPSEFAPQSMDTSNYEESYMPNWTRYTPAASQFRLPNPTESHSAAASAKFSRFKIHFSFQTRSKGSHCEKLGARLQVLTKEREIRRQREAEKAYRHLQEVARWAAETRREEEALHAQLENMEREDIRVEACQEAWRAYEARWAAITARECSSSKELLVFRSIRWPMLSQPQSIEDITVEQVAEFILSPLHSQGQARRDRLKAALLRWHPDRFGRVLARVDALDRDDVEEGVGIVARCLNHLLATVD